MQAVWNTYWDAGKSNLTAQNTRKPFGGQGCPLDPAEGTYSAPVNRLVGVEGLAVPSPRTPSSPLLPPTPELVPTPLPATTWNSLPASLRDDQLSVAAFCGLLKTELFTRAYDSSLARSLVNVVNCKSGRTTTLLVLLLLLLAEVVSDFSMS